MLDPLKLAFALCLPVIMTSVTIEIDGVIDLGPKWNFEYSVKPDILRSASNALEPVTKTPKHMKLKTIKTTTDSTVKPKNKTTKHTVKPELSRSPRFTAKPEIPTTPSKPTTAKREERIVTTTEHRLVTPHDAVTILQEVESNIFNKPHAVREDKQINDFTFHVYKQSLKVFDMLKKKVDPKFSHKVDFIARSYDEKFRNFVDNTLNHNIKTRLGTQKVILNTIDTSNLLMKRLINYFLGEMSKEGALRNGMNVVNVFRTEVEKETTLEYKHICSKFGICRAARGFNNLMVEIFIILLKCNDNMLKLASDALTEVLKNTDFSYIMSKSTWKNFQKKIADAETWDATMTRAMFTIMKNLFALKNQPLKVMMHGTEYVQSTVVALEIIDEFDKALPSHDENVLAWADITNSLEQWQENKRDDILEIFQNLMSHISDSGIASMNKETQDKLKSKFRFIFS